MSGFDFLSVDGWCLPGRFLEISGKSVDIIKSHLKSDFRDKQIIHSQQFFRFFYPQRIHIFHRAYAQIFFEIAREVAVAHSGGFGQRFESYFF